MALLNEDTVRSLASVSGDGAPVVSCYLDVDGRRYPRRQDYEAQLDHLLRRARSRADGGGSPADDLARIEAHVHGGFDRTDTRGLALFSCEPSGLWTAIPLAVPVRNQIVVNQSPAVGQLELLLHTYERIGVLLVDRQQTRVLVFELGVLVDRSEVLDELPRDYDQRGEKERGDTQHHVEDLVDQHLRRAAAAAFAAFQAQEFSHLLVGAPAELAGTVEHHLHPYLQERLGGRLNVTVGAPDDVVREAVLEAEDRLVRERETATVERLRDAVGAGRRAVAGLEGVLQALVERRIDLLVVSEGYAEAGWRCPSCAYLAAVGRTCPLCGAEMAEVPDVVEDAIEEALLQSCRIEICVGNADLDVLGRVGAFLRY
ncbi:MAG: hypothetical protein KDB35_16825 [Acidimicrobiales bacterium]|nr:hypothetical protein [Acidimicrobiales bacterium]